MPIKKQPAEKWTVLSGEYVTGDPESVVSVITLGLYRGDMPIGAGAAISRSLHNENLGIEKIIANTSFKHTNSLKWSVLPLIFKEE